MIEKILLAYLAALIVIGLPGYIWSKLLFPCIDWVERIAASIAISIGIVPAIALLLARMSDTGITPAIAYTSVILAIAIGIALYLLLGPSPKPEMLPSLQITSPSAPALVGISALAVVTYAMIIGKLDVQKYSPRMVPLVLAIGGLWFLAKGRPAKLWWVKFEPSYKSRALSYLQGILVILLSLFRGYSGPVLRDWPYIRGHDQYAHAIMTNLMISQGYSRDYMIYPPGFHTLTAILSHVSHLSPLDIYIVLSPALMVLPALGCYVLASRMIGPRYAFPAAVFASLVFDSSWLYLVVGIYVDVITGQFLLAMFLATVTTIVCNKLRNLKRQALLLALLGFTIVLYHTVSTLYLAIISLAVIVLLLPYLLWKDRRPAVALASSFLLMAILSLPVLWETYDLPHVIAAFLGSTAKRGAAQLASSLLHTQIPLTIARLPNYLSPIGFWIGCIGLLVLLVSLVFLPPRYRLTLALLLVWGIAFFGAARTPTSISPWRFDRDTAIPLSILSAVALVAMSGKVRRAWIIQLAALTLIIFALFTDIQRNLYFSSLPSGYLVMNRSIEAAAEWLKEHNDGGRIISTPYIHHAANNALLAIAGYSELESAPADNLRDPRTVLPGEQQQEVSLSLWVVTHPDSGRTIQILQQYDVRYIVVFEGFEKYLDEPYKETISSDIFLDYPNLYRLEYQGYGVMIFKVLV